METVQSYLKENPVEIRGLSGILDPDEISRTYNEMHRNAYRSGGFVSQTVGVTVEDPDLDLPTEEYMEKLNDEVYSSSGPSAFDTPTRSYTKDRFDYISGQTPLAHTVQRDSLNRRMIGYGFNLESDENFAMVAGVLDLKPEEVEEIRDGEVAISTAQARSLYEAQVSQADRLISERTDDAPLRGNQRMVLTAMAIHNPELLGPGLTEALSKGDISGAIDEIANKSNASNSRALRVRREQDAQHFGNYTSEDEQEDEELGVMMGIRPQARPTRTGPETSTSPQARPTRTGPETSTSPQARPMRTGPETSTSPQARPTRTGPETSTRPQARTSHRDVATRFDEALPKRPEIRAGEPVEASVRDSFGSMAVTAWKGFNNSVRSVIAGSGVDEDSAVHFYTAEAYQAAASAGQVEAGTDIVIGSVMGFSTFTHIEGDDTPEDVPDTPQELTPDFYDNLSIITDIREGRLLEGAADVFEQVGEAVDTGVLAVKTTTAKKLGQAVELFQEYVGEADFREFTTFAQNFISPGQTLTEADLGEDELGTMTSLIIDAKSRGLSAVDYSDLGTSEANAIDSPGVLGGIYDPMTRIQRVVGGFQFSENEAGETIVNNTYNFNGNPVNNKSRVAFYEAYKESDYDMMTEIAYEFRTRPVSLASIIGYVRQEELKANGHPFETQMIINLGVLD